MTDLPFPDGTFDKVYCMHVLAHIRDQKAAVTEAMRVLKKGGKLMVFTPNKRYVQAIKLAGALGLIPPFEYDPNSTKDNSTANWMFTRRSLARLLGADVEYFRKAPSRLPFPFLREKLVGVAEKP